MAAIDTGDTPSNHDSPSERKDGGRRLVAAVTLLTSIVGATLFYSVPMESKTTVWMTATGIMLALMYVGVFRFRSANLKPWLLITGGLSSAYLAMFLMNYGHWFGWSFGSPSILDALSLANYPLAMLGGIVLLSRHHVRTGMHALLETVTLTIAGGLLIWVFVGVRATQAADASTLAKVVAAMYPLGNVLLLAVIASVAVRLKQRPSGMLLVTLGFLGNLVADLISSYQRLEGIYSPGGWVDFGWLLCFAGLSLAPSAPETAQSNFADSLDADTGQVTAGRMALLLFALFSAPAVLIGQRFTTDDASQAVATMGTVVVFALALARIALYNRDLRTNERQLLAAQAELRDAEEKKKHLLWRMNRAVEEERKRIAAEIHDRPVQKLAAVGYQVELAAIALATQDNERAAEICDDVADELSEQLTALRNLMVDIRPPVLDERGLLGALDDAGGSFMRDNPAVRVEVLGDDVRLDDEVETVLYRIAQEAFTNIAKHADATEVTVRLAASDASTGLEIRDNGCGFDASKVAGLVREGHFGLAGMEERVAMIDGSMKLSALPGAGTQLNFNVPGRRPKDDFDKFLEETTTTQATLTTSGAN